MRPLTYHAESWQNQCPKDGMWRQATESLGTIRPVREHRRADVGADPQDSQTRGHLLQQDPDSSILEAGGELSVQSGHSQ
jgi:hypothetical protein